MAGSTRVPREEGFSKDTDKLIRRLSLVALLLSRHGQPVAVAEIRRQVEGYPLMSDDAFKRRFYEDRAELAELGIVITGEPVPGSGEVYSLPASAYYLPPVTLSGEELSALAACLLVLEDRFAYSKPLRLALVSLAQGRPELLAGQDAPPLAVLPNKDARRAMALLPKLQAAIADRKTVTFSYYAIGRDEELERTVDPYGLQLVGEEWYLIGYCHLRDAIRTFRLSRAGSRVRFATRSAHDFSVPPDFDLGDYRARPAWQLGGPQGAATIAVAAEMAWWIKAHFSHCGTITKAGEAADNEVAGEADSGGGERLVFVTPYASARPLVDWVLGLGLAAEIVAPPELRELAARELHLLAERLNDPPLPAATAMTAMTAMTDTTATSAVKTDTAVTRTATAVAKAGGARSTADGQKRRPADDWRVEVDRFTRLTALSSYLLKHSDSDDETPLPVEQVCAALGLSPAELRADVRLLNLVNFGGDGSLLWAEFKGGELLVTGDMAGPSLTPPARLSPLQADTLLLAVELVGGQLPSATGAALVSAAQKLRRARQGAAPTVAAGELLPPQDDVLAAVNTAIKDQRLLEIEYWSEGAGETTQRTVEPYLMIRNRGEWYYVSFCLKSQGVRVFRVATTKRAVATTQRFRPRPDLELDLYRREGIPASSRYAPKTAVVWYSPNVARWISERQPTTTLPDGACLADQPYMDEAWLTHHLLGFGGGALALAPPAAVAALSEAAATLLARYERTDA